MILRNKQIAIIGAGPVGLTMARLLQQQGASVTVYERDKDPQARIWGGTLDLHETTGQAALARSGLLEDYFAMAQPMGRTITDEQGNLLFSVPPQYATPEINRNNLRKLLLASLSTDTVIWDRKFTSLEEHDGKWLLHFDNKPTATADLVIGANGGMSKLREYVTGTTAEDTGSFIIQGEVSDPAINCPAFYQLCNNNLLMTAYGGNLFVASPDNNGLLTYSIIFKTPDEWVGGKTINFHDAETGRAFLLDRLLQWDNRYSQLLQATSSFWGLPARKLTLDKPWESDRLLPITLIGDAAHLMPPFAGQGVNTGLLDALILSTNLTNGTFDTIEAAISDYERQMFIYAKAAQLETSKNELEMRSPEFSFQKRFDDGQ